MTTIDEETCELLVKKKVSSPLMMISMLLNNFSFKLFSEKIVCFVLIAYNSILTEDKQC